MPISIIGAGVGRTGTYSLKLALEHLGHGPCYHMEEVARDLPRTLPLWQSVMDGASPWQEIFDGFGSAVDWPTASFYRELQIAYPDAKFILTTRSPESWAASFAETISSLIAGKAKAPPPIQEWLATAERAIALSGFEAGSSLDKLTQAFEAHNAAVKAAIPEEKLLVFEVKEGWVPLCRFLECDAPDVPFPRTNSRKEFWELVENATSGEG